MRFLTVLCFLLLACSDDESRSGVADSGLDVDSGITVFDQDASSREEDSSDSKIQDSGDEDTSVIDEQDDSSTDANSADVVTEDANDPDTQETEEEIIEDLPAEFLVDNCTTHPAYEKRCPEEKCISGEFTNYEPGCPGMEHAHYYFCMRAREGSEKEWRLFCLCMCE